MPSYSSPSSGGLFIDALTRNQGYVTAGYVGDKPKYERLKFQVKSGDRVYNYDLDPKGDPKQFPINMGNGSYRFRVMERVEGNSYAEVMSVTKTVKLRSKYVPYTVSNVFCAYTADSPCVRWSRLLCATVEGHKETEVLDLVSGFVAKRVSYDFDKAKRLSGASGYIPNPDVTYREGKGVCFDYASLTAAMLRCVGIPCRVVTGYVGDDMYHHAWVVAHVDNRWRRRDPTLMSAGKTAEKYTNRYIY